MNESHKWSAQRGNRSVACKTDACLEQQEETSAVRRTICDNGGQETEAKSQLQTTWGSRLVEI